MDEDEIRKRENRIQPAGQLILDRDQETPRERPRPVRRPPPREVRPRAKPVGTAVVRGFQYVVIGAGLLGTAFLSAFITFALAIRGNEVAVPELIGMEVAEATDRLVGAELTLRHEGSRFDTEIEPDRIMAQEPLPGAKLKKGRSVKVWVSLGPQRRTVPRIEGETLQAAQLALEQHGFSLGRVVEVESELYAPDTVIAQVPAAYEEAGDTSEVNVLLSRGYRDQAYVMPDFIGQDYVNVMDRVTRSGLRLGNIRYVDYPGVPRGTVVRQTPTGGTKVHKRDRIVLYVSRGT